MRGAVKIDYEPALMESVVRRELERLERGPVSELAAEYRRLAHALYAMPLTEDRELRFERLHLDFFQRLQFDRAVRAVLEEFPHVTAAIDRFVVLEAVARAQEWVDFSPKGELRTVWMRLGAWRFQAPAALVEFLRRELVHVVDLLDPSFRFTPQSSLAEHPSEEGLIRDRYRLLWSASVAGRLERAGHDVTQERRRIEAEVDAVYRQAPSKARARIVERFWSGERPDHPSLLAFARDTRSLLAGIGLDDATVRQTGPAPGAPCPVCRFPTHDWHAGTLATPVVRAIQADVPSWEPDRGLCDRCADIYELGAAAAPSRS